MTEKAQPETDLNSSCQKVKNQAPTVTGYGI